MSECDSQCDSTLDTSGLFCPEPVMMLHSKVRDMAVGDTVEVLATDPATTRDIPKFCSFLGHDLYYQAEDGDCYIYRLRKGGEA